MSTDYLLNLTENENPANAELQALHLRDDAMDAIRDGKYNKRLLSELLVHDKFQQLIGILSDIREAHRQDATTADRERAALTSLTARVIARNKSVG